MVVHKVEAKDLVYDFVANVTLFGLIVTIYFYAISTYVNKRLELGRYIAKNRLVKLSGE